MRAGGQKLMEPLRGLGDRVRARDADRIEAFGAGGFDKGRLQRGGI
jgi:hypothetical protein